MQRSRLSNKSKKRDKSARTLDFFKMGTEPIKEEITRSPVHLYPKATPGTLEFFRDQLYTYGVRSMITELRLAFPIISPESFTKIANYITFGVDRHGNILEEPKIPNPNLMTTDTKLYRYQERIWNLWKKHGE